ncbi:MAG: ribokinase [Armatimonadota bacterium]
MARLLVVGSINMDLIVRCARLPREGETIHGEDLVTAGGGKGANQAVAASRLGAETTLIGRVGEDEFGPRLCAALQEDGVDTQFIAADPQARTGAALILLEASGANRIVIMSGANAQLGDEEVAAARSLLGRSDVVLMQLETPTPVVAAVARAAREAGVVSILDAGAATRAAFDAGLPALVDVISPNESEAASLTGVEVEDLGSARRAALVLREAGSKDVVVKLGAAGAYWLGEQGDQHFPGFPIQPVDTTAAGDAFTACLAIGIADGLAMPDAIRRANAAGALACLKLGAQPSMPTRAEVDVFLSERGGRAALPH